MKKYNIAILGATGAVGRQMTELLTEYKLPVGELKLLASKKSAGKKIEFQGKELVIEEVCPKSFKGCDFVLGAVSKGLAKELAPAIKASGAVFIDNSSAFRMDPDVPLVVPEINGEDALKHNGRIANPNCSTIITMMAVAGIAKLSPIESMTACTYQAVSGAGQAGIDDFIRQKKALAAGERIVPTKFPTQIADNVIPFIGNLLENDYTDEEMKMQNEGRRILHLPQLNVCCTCVRVPVMRSHSIALTVQTKDNISVYDAAKAIDAFPGCRYITDLEGRSYPTPIDTSGKDIVYAGRLRIDNTRKNSLALWCCGDQIRKGAASNAVQIMKLLMNN